MDLTGRAPEEPETRPDQAAALPGDQAADAPAARRPSPGPSATSRARRAAAAGVAARRPSPRPHAEPATTEAEPATTEAERTTKGGPATAVAARPGAEPPVAGTEPGSPRQAPLWLAVLLGVLVLVAAAAVVLAATLPARSGSTDERDRALAAAKSEVPLILSYNYASFDADLAKAKAQLTGRAVSDYVTAMNQTIKPAAVKVQAVVQAQTDGAGVESVSPDGRQVVAVVFGEQKVSNTSLTAPRTDLFRVRATLDLVGGRWLISKFDQI